MKNQYRNDQGQPIDGPNAPSANTRIDTTIDRNQPIEPQGNGSTVDDAMARSEQWADGTVTHASNGNTRADQARKSKLGD